jgi:hypothetical protein
MLIIQEYFYCVDWVYGSALHGDRCAACFEAHMNFADESACLMADNVWNEGSNQLVDSLIALCYMASSVVHVCEYNLSAVSSNYQLH